jgi:hypothetical protein
MNVRNVLVAVIVFVFSCVALSLLFSAVAGGNVSNSLLSPAQQPVVGPVEIEVTRVVTERVEVTRIVEVEVETPTEVRETGAEVIEAVEVEEVVVVETASETAETAELRSACSSMLANINPFAVDGIKVVQQGLPTHGSWRDAVLRNGDTGTGLVYFGRDYPAVTFDRAVADDEFTRLVYCPANGSPVDLLPMVEMTWVTTDTLRTMSSDLVAVLKSRGVDVVEGEILQQNMYSVFLGPVEEGSFIFAVMQDNPRLGVNNGGLFAFVSDTTAYAVDLQGNSVPEEEWTFFISE